MSELSDEKTKGRFPWKSSIALTLFVALAIVLVEARKNSNSSAEQKMAVPQSKFEIAYDDVSDMGYHRTDEERAAAAEKMLAAISSHEEARKARRYFRDTHDLELAAVYADVAYAKWIDFSIRALSEPQGSVEDVVRRLEVMPFWEKSVSDAVKKIPGTCDQFGTLYRFYDRDHELSRETGAQVAETAKELSGEWHRVCRMQVQESANDLPKLSALYQEVPSTLHGEVEALMMPLFSEQVKSSQDVAAALKVFELVTDSVRDGHPATFDAQMHLLGLANTTSEMVTASPYLRYPATVSELRDKKWKELSRLEIAAADSKEKAVKAWTSAPPATKAEASRKVASYLK